MCVKLIFYRWQLSVVALEHGTCLHRVSRLGNPFVSLSHYHHLSHHTPLSHSENTSVIVVLWVGFLYSHRVKCCQICVSCQVKCSREVNHESCLSYCVSPVPTLLCYITSQSILCFVSLMGETLWPSFDESLPVDANISSKC